MSRQVPPQPYGPGPSGSLVNGPVSNLSPFERQNTSQIISNNVDNSSAINSSKYGSTPSTMTGPVMGVGPTGDFSHPHPDSYSSLVISNIGMTVPFPAQTNQNQAHQQSDDSYLGTSTSSLNPRIVRQMKEEGALQASASRINSPAQYV